MSVGVLVDVGVSVGVNVGVSVFVSVGVKVSVGAFVSVGVKVDVAVSVAVGMSVLVGVFDGIAVFVAVSVGMFVFVGVFVGISVLVGVLVDVLVAVDELQAFVVDDVLRGFGEPVAKSELLLSVSVQPLDARKLDVMFVCADSVVPSKLFAPPYPTKSTIFGFGKQSPLELPHDNVAVLFVSATLPPEIAMFVAPLALGVGSVEPHGLPEHPLVEPI